MAANALDISLKLEIFHKKDKKFQTMVKPEKFSPADAELVIEKFFSKRGNHAITLTRQGACLIRCGAFRHLISFEAQFHALYRLFLAITYAMLGKLTV